MTEKSQFPRNEDDGILLEFAGEIDDVIQFLQNLKRTYLLHSAVSTVIEVRLSAQSRVLKQGERYSLDLTASTGEWCVAPSSKKRKQATKHEQMELSI